MLPKRARIQRKNFPSLYRMRKMVGEFFVVYIQEEETKAASVVVPKKIEKSSVERHKIKRRIYAICSKHFDLLQGVYIIFPTKSAKGIKFDILERSLCALISKNKQ